MGRVGNCQFSYNSPERNLKELRSLMYSSFPDKQLAALDRLSNDMESFLNSAAPFTELIRRRIAAEGGKISFRDYMDMALNHPEFGYYSRATVRFDHSGDFVTSPEIHPIYGGLWGRQIIQCWETMGKPELVNVVEIGGGSGAFISAVLSWIRQSSADCFSSLNVTVVDGSDIRLEEQKKKIEITHSDIVRQIDYVLLDEWLAQDGSLKDVVLFCNEFFDALPVHLIERDPEPNSVLHELFVTVDENQNFQYERQPLTNSELIDRLDSIYEADLVSNPVPFPGTRIEVNLEANKVMSAITEIIKDGYIFVSDYGYITDELYASWRTTGTLMAFRKQNIESDLFRLPGLTDITAHVDFGSLFKAARGEWQQQGLVSQAETMVGLGLYEVVNADTSWAKTNPERFLTLRQAAERLCDPSGLGRIRVLVLSKTSSEGDLMCLSKVLV